MVHGNPLLVSLTIFLVISIIFQVHVVPAHMFRKVISLTKSHCKLGLTGMRLKHLDDFSYLITMRRMPLTLIKLQPHW